MAQARTQRSDIRVEKTHEPQEQPRDHQQGPYSTAGQGLSLGNHIGIGGGDTWGQVSGITWDDSQPA